MIRDGYKMTELGEIPEDWAVKKLGEIFEIRTKSIKPYEFKNEYFLHYSLPAFDESGIPILEKGNLIRSNKTIIDQDSLLVSKLNPRIKRIWKVEYIPDYKQISSTEFINYSPKNKEVFIEYYYHFFNSDNFQENLQLLEKGSTGSRKRVSPSETLDIFITVPIIKEQQKIADILSTVDEQLEQTDQLIKKTKELKKGLMQKLLTKGIGHTEFKQTEVGEIPVEWEVKALGEIGEFIKGKGIAKKDISDNGVKCILYGQLYTTYKESIKTVNTYTNAKINNPVIGQINDLLIPSSGETAIDIATASALNINGVYIGGDINLFRPTELIDSNYLSYQISSIRKNDLAKLAQGSTVYHLYAPSLKKLKVVIPSIKEQQKIADILSSVDDQLEEYNTKIEKLELLKKGLMQQLLIGKIRVKV